MPPQRPARSRRLVLTCLVLLLALCLPQVAVAAGEEAPTLVAPVAQTSTVGTAIAPLVVEGMRMAELTAVELPAGLTLERISGTEGRITGKPTHAETVTVALHAKNTEGVEVSVTFGWTVEPEAAPTLVAPVAQTSTVGTPIAPVMVEGTHMAELTAQELPAGLTLERISGTEGRITGEPTHAETVTVALHAKNTEGVEVSVTFGWTVEAAAVVVIPPPPNPAPTAAGQLTVSPTIVFSAAKATCSGLTWSSSTLSTEWLLDGVPIAGATTGVYAPPRADDGHQLSCRQTATGAAGATSSAASAASTIHEQPPQPAWSIGPASERCSTPVCMRAGSGIGASTESYAQGRTWWVGQQIRCVSAPWTSAAGESTQAAVRALVEAHTVSVTLQRVSSSGATVTLASQPLSDLTGVQDQLDGAGSPFPGEIVQPYGAEPFASGELWSRHFPAAVGQPDWFAPGAGLIVYDIDSSVGVERSFQLIYTLTAADLGTRLRCVVGATDGPAAAATAASFTSAEYRVPSTASCAPRRVAGGGPQPTLVQAGASGCLRAPSGAPALDEGFQGVAVSGGKAALALACWLPGGCDGTLSLLSRARGHGVLAKAAVRVRRAADGLAHLTLGPAARHLLARSGAGGLAASVVLSGPGAERTLASVRLLG
jgi:Putative Ig domain